MCRVTVMSRGEKRQVTALLGPGGLVGSCPHLFTPVSIAYQSSLPFLAVLVAWQSSRHCGKHCEKAGVTGTIAEEADQIQLRSHAPSRYLRAKKERPDEITTRTHFHSGRPVYTPTAFLPLSRRRLDG